MLPSQVDLAPLPPVSLAATVTRAGSAAGDRTSAAWPGDGGPSLGATIKLAGFSRGF
jgi:hypothetical protein